MDNPVDCAYTDRCFTACTTNSKIVEKSSIQYNISSNLVSIQIQIHELFAPSRFYFFT